MKDYTSLHRRDMDRRRLLLTSLAGALAIPLVARAQPIGKVSRIGFIVTGTPNEARHLIQALTEGLGELGYVEGRNIVFEWRFGEGRQEKLPALAVELARLKVDVLVTGSNPVIAAVKQATATIPVVMAVSRDPVGANFIASLDGRAETSRGWRMTPIPRLSERTLSF
jgi:putative ABC transport system substrate-binding protein